MSPPGHPKGEHQREKPEGAPVGSPRFDAPADAARWLAARVSGTLRADSRRVRPGDGFVAWPGTAVDGRDFVGAALAGGAAACLVEAEGVAAYGFDDERIGTLPGLKAAAGAVADAFFGHPGRALDLVATTGTNGKTSTAWWVAQALAALGGRCAVVGTLGIGEPPAADAAAGAGRAPRIPLEPSGLTTPDPVTMHAALRRFVDAGFTACALEASSIGLDEQRLNALAIDVALFTNFTQDHLDYHGSMDAYWAAKRRLFDWPGLRAAVLNVDDPAIAGLNDALASGGGLDLWPYAAAGAAPGHAAPAARLHARDVRYADGGLAFEVVEAAPGGAAAGRADVRCGLIGEYNVGNLLGVIGVLRALGVPLAEATAVLPRLTPVPGRLQRVPAPAGVADRTLPEVVVDYAHTPDALAQVLRALRPLAEARGGRLWCVFGCGGDRDPTKRPRMGAAAEALADTVVLTSDNPRSEPPEAILAQIAGGLKRPGAAAVIESRRAAIAHAVGAAAAADVVLVAGKGHETTQEIAGVKHPFSDVDEVAAALAARALAAVVARPEVRA